MFPRGRTCISLEVKVLKKKKKEASFPLSSCELLEKVAFLVPTSLCSVVVDALPVEKLACAGCLLSSINQPDLYEEGDCLSV